jgi:hypothetical protein
VLYMTQLEWDRLSPEEKKEADFWKHRLASGEPVDILDRLGLEVFEFLGHLVRVVNCGGWYCEMYRRRRFMGTTHGKCRTSQEAIEAARTMIQNRMFVDDLAVMLQEGRRG